MSAAAGAGGNGEGDIVPAVYVNVDGATKYKEAATCSASMVDCELLKSLKEDEIFTAEFEGKALGRCRLYVMGVDEPSAGLKASTRELTGERTLSSELREDERRAAKVYVYVNTTAARLAPAVSAPAPAPAPAGGAGASGPAGGVDAGVLASIQKSLDALISAQTRDASIVSRTFLGKKVMRSLQAVGVVQVFPGYEGESPFLTDDELSELQRRAAAGDKHHMVAYMTPILQRILVNAASGDALPWAMVNSEYTGWLRKTDFQARVHHAQHRAPLMPDLFVTYKPFCRLTSKRSSEVQNKSEDCLFGKLSHQLHNECGILGLLDAKKGAITIEDFGSMVEYHRCCDYPVWSMLFTEQEFWMCESYTCDPVRVVKAKWDQPGSMRMAQEFVSRRRLLPPVGALLRDALRKNGLQLHYVADGDEYYCHLGSGASGNVFAVTPAGMPAPIMALKVSDCSSVSQLMGEFDALQRAAAVGAPVVPVISESLVCSGDAGGGYYVMGACGEACPIKRSLWLCKAAVDALQRLHAAGCFHGDARIPNLLLKPAVEGAARDAFWIDLQMTIAASALSAEQALSLFRDDARALAASLLRTHADALPESVLAHIKAYRPLVSATVDALASALWEAAMKAGLD